MRKERVLTLVNVVLTGISILVTTLDLASHFMR